MQTDDIPFAGPDIEVKEEVRLEWVEPKKLDPRMVLLVYQPPRPALSVAEETTSIRLKISADAQRDSERPSLAVVCDAQTGKTYPIHLIVREPDAERARACQAKTPDSAISEPINNRGLIFFRYAGGELRAPQDIEDDMQMKGMSVARKMRVVTAYADYVAAPRLAQGNRNMARAYADYEKTARTSPFRPDYEADPNRDRYSAG